MRVEGAVLRDEGKSTTKLILLDSLLQESVDFAPTLISEAQSAK